MKSLSLPTCLAAAGLTLAATAARATEDGSQEYPLGVNTVLPALLPPPGHAAYLNYLEYYTAPIVTESNGTKAQVGFHFNLELEAGRFLYSWPVSLGNFGITSGFRAGGRQRQHSGRPAERRPRRLGRYAAAAPHPRLQQPGP